MRRLDEYLKEADNERGYILASLTDEYIVDKWPMEYCNLKGKEDKILEIVNRNFDLTPKGIIEYLGLREPIFTKTTNYGHFGKAELPWEKIIELK